MAEESPRLKTRQIKIHRKTSAEMSTAADQSPDVVANKLVKSDKGNESEIAQSTQEFMKCSATSQIPKSQKVERTDEEETPPKSDKTGKLNNYFSGFLAKKLEIIEEERRKLEISAKEKLKDVKKGQSQDDGKTKHKMIKLNKKQKQQVEEYLERTAQVQEVDIRSGNDGDGKVIPNVDAVAHKKSKKSKKSREKKHKHKHKKERKKDKHSENGQPEAKEKKHKHEKDKHKLIGKEKHEKKVSEKRRVIEDNPGKDQDFFEEGENVCDEEEVTWRGSHLERGRDNRCEKQGDIYPCEEWRQKGDRQTSARKLLQKTGYDGLGMWDTPADSRHDKKKFAGGSHDRTSGCGSSSYDREHGNLKHNQDRCSGEYERDSLDPDYDHQEHHRRDYRSDEYNRESFSRYRDNHEHYKRDQRGSNHERDLFEHELKHYERTRHHYERPNREWYYHGTSHHGKRDDEYLEQEWAQESWKHKEEEVAQVLMEREGVLKRKSTRVDKKESDLDVGSMTDDEDGTIEPSKKRRKGSADQKSCGHHDNELVQDTEEIDLEMGVEKSMVEEESKALAKIKKLKESVQNMKASMQGMSESIGAKVSTGKTAPKIIEKVTVESRSGASGSTWSAPKSLITGTISGIQPPAAKSTLLSSVSTAKQGNSSDVQPSANSSSLSTSSGSGNTKFDDVILVVDKDETKQLLNAKTSNLDSTKSGDEAHKPQSSVLKPEDIVDLTEADDEDRKAANVKESERKIKLKVASVLPKNDHSSTGSQKPPYSISSDNEDCRPGSGGKMKINIGKVFEPRGNNNPKPGSVGSNDEETHQTGPEEKSKKPAIKFGAIKISSSSASLISSGVRLENDPKKRDREDGKCSV